MMISTKGRYALRVMLDLAENFGGTPQLLSDMAERQDLSEKYLEAIMATLSKSGFVHAQRGRGGGYRLSRSPREYTIGSILRQLEGSLAPVTCLEDPSVPCENAATCPTLPVWQGLNEVINNYLDGVTLQDLLEQSKAK